MTGRALPLCFLVVWLSITGAVPASTSVTAATAVVSSATNNATAGTGRNAAGWRQILVSESAAPSAAQLNALVGGPYGPGSTVTIVGADFPSTTVPGSNSTGAVVGTSVRPPHRPGGCRPGGGGHRGPGGGGRPGAGGGGGGGGGVAAQINQLTQMQALQMQMMQQLIQQQQLRGSRVRKLRRRSADSSAQSAASNQALTASDTSKKSGEGDTTGDQTSKGTARCWGSNRPFTSNLGTGLINRPFVTGSTNLGTGGIPFRARPYRLSGRRKRSAQVGARCGRGGFNRQVGGFGFNRQGVGIGGFPGAGRPVRGFGK